MPQPAIQALIADFDTDLTAAAARTSDDLFDFLLRYSFKLVTEAAAVFMFCAV